MPMTPAQAAVQLPKLVEALGRQFVVTRRDEGPFGGRWWGVDCATGAKHYAVICPMTGRVFIDSEPPGSKKHREMHEATAV